MPNTPVTSDANTTTGLNLSLTQGTLNPIGSVVVGLPGGDAAAVKARDSLLRAGTPANDIQLIERERMRLWMELQLRDTGVLAGFGSEVIYMRECLALAVAGAGWLIVKAPDDAARGRILRMAQTHRAGFAVKYNLLAHEELPLRPDSDSMEDLPRP